MDIKVSEKSLRGYLKTKATTKEIIDALTFCGPTVDRFHQADNDTIFEIESITNRIDTSSVFGVARDCNAILQQMDIDSNLEKSPYDAKPIDDKNQSQKININVQGDNLVIRFSAAIFYHCNVQESPQETKDLLLKSDQRPLNNLIDITNEITLFYGLPTHVFDLDKLAVQSLTIRPAKRGEYLNTLDDQKQLLEDGDIIIEDGTGRIVDLCGIMGGQVAEVDDHTKNILFIAPVYDPKKIRQTSLRLQKRTLAAQIYEKSPDPELTVHILSLAKELISERTGATLGSKVFDYYPNSIKKNQVSLELDWLERFSGIKIDIKNITKILENLGFEDVKISGNTLTCVTPSFRGSDVTLPEDLAEEIIRVYGYYNIPETLPSITVAPEKPNPIFGLEEKIRNYLSVKGYFEIYNSSLISLQDIQKYGDNATSYLKLTNALSSDFEYLRKDLVISTLINHKNNQGKTDNQKKFFEIANSYHPTGNQLPDEISTLCFSSDQTIQIIKADLEGLFDLLNQIDYSILQATDSSGKIINNGKEIGVIQNISPKIQNNFEIDKTVSVVEIDLQSLLGSLENKKTFSPISEYPDLKFDITIKSKLPVGEIISQIKSHHELIHSVQYLSSFEGKHSFTISLRSYTENLTKETGTQIQNSLSSLF